MPRQGPVPDRDVQRAARPALELSQQQEIDQVKRHLLAAEPALQAHVRRVPKHQPLVEQLTPAGPQDTPPHQALNRQQSARPAADRRYENGRTKRREALAQSPNRSAKIQAPTTAPAATQSRWEAMITAPMVRMDPAYPVGCQTA